MEKHILQWTYWLGLACLAVAVVWRALNALGSVIPLPAFLGTGKFIWYGGFQKWGLLLLVASIATSSFIWSRRQHQ
jgi:hypothetical protein